MKGQVLGLNNLGESNYAITPCEGNMLLNMVNKPQKCPRSWIQT